MSQTYQTSTDYETLFHLILKGKRIVCFVDYENTCRDVCVAKLYHGQIHLSARGISYGWYRKISEKDLFIADCKELELSFIEPNLQ